MKSMDEKKFYVELFPAGWGRWNFIAWWDDGIVLRSTKPIFRYWKAKQKAYTVAQEARHAS